MALNKKTFAIRSVSALVFGALLIGCVYWNYFSFGIFFFAVALLGLNEFYKIAGNLGAKPFKFPGFIFGALTYFNFIYYDAFCLNDYLLDFHNIINSLLFIMPFVILAAALYSKKEDSVKSAMFTIGGVIYSVLPFALLNQIVFAAGGESGKIFEPKLILGIIFLIWSSDTFAYIGGSLFGKHKLIERVSPGKTWEGTIIGILITFAISFTFNHLYKLNDFIWPLLGMFIPILATIGDLVESKLKREAGIKDTGNIIPGHGGILDRFDSLIFVSPFVYAFFNLIF